MSASTDVAPKIWGWDARGVVVVEAARLAEDQIEKVGTSFKGMLALHQNAFAIQG